MKIAAQRDLAAWGPYVDRLADLAIARLRGHITDREYKELRAIVKWTWMNL